MIRQCAILFGCLALGELIVFFDGYQASVQHYRNAVAHPFFLKLGWIKLQWVQGAVRFLGC